MRNKYNAKKVKYDDITFDSIAEYERYLILKHRLSKGEISELQVHIRYWIYVNGEKAFQYETDFQYKELTPRLIVEDVKGKMTDTSRLKIKCFKLQYPNIEHRLIHKGKRVEKL